MLKRVKKGVYTVLVVALLLSIARIIMLKKDTHTEDKAIVDVESREKSAFRAYVSDGTDEKNNVQFGKASFLNKASKFILGTDIFEKIEIQPAVYLTFVDVYGESYRAEIIDNVPKMNYDLKKFIHDGYRLKYEDDTYCSRLGVDVSHHQGYIDWNKVKSDGFEFAYIRLGYRGYGRKGSINLDREFHRNIKNAQEAGLDVGVYFFSQAINEDEAAEEAGFVLGHLEGYELQLPVVYDPESILDDEARTDNVSGEQFTKNALTFCSIIEKAGRKPMIYSNMLWEAFEFDMAQVGKYPFWYADYELKPQTPYDFIVWQYSNEGYVKGIRGVTDLNIELKKK